MQWLLLLRSTGSRYWGFSSYGLIVSLVTSRHVESSQILVLCTGREIFKHWTKGSPKLDPFIICKMRKWRQSGVEITCCKTPSVNTEPGGRTPSLPDLLRCIGTETCPSPPCPALLSLLLSQGLSCSQHLMLVSALSPSHIKGYLCSSSR